MSNKPVRTVSSLLLVAFLGVGCKGIDFPSYFVLESSARSNDRVIEGSVDATSRSVQGAFHQLGMATTVSKKDDTVRIASKTRTGEKFTFVLSKAKSGEAEATRIHIDWDGPPDDQMGFQVLGLVESQGKS